jgi:TetR/AcrR family transcriptional regulator, cholesterol catabolism regulator
VPDGVPVAQPKRGPGRPPKHASRPGETRARIKLAATELFAEKGFHGTGVTEIGDRAGIQRGSLYYHIKSKDDLLWQIISDHLRASAAAVKGIAESDTQPQEKLRALIRHQVAFVIERRLEMVIFQRDRDAVTGARALAMREMLDAVTDQWRRVVHEGHQAGAFVTADPVVINALLSMVNMTHVWFREGGGKSVREVADTLADLAFTGLVG